MRISHGNNETSAYFKLLHKGLRHLWSARRNHNGVERLMLLLTGMHNIRDVIPFPRYPGCADF